MGKIKIIGIAGSPRHGNTEIMVKEALKGAQELAEVETEFVTLAGKQISACLADYRCFFEKDPNEPCASIKNDDANEIVRKLGEVDAMIIGTPVYWHGMSAQLKALLDRTMGMEAQGFLLRNKVGGALAVAREKNLGLETTLMDIHLWMIMNDMIIVGPGPDRRSQSALGATGLQLTPNVSGKLGRTPKEALSSVDESGIAASRNLGRRVCEVAKAVKSGFSKLPDNERYYPVKGMDLRKCATIRPGLYE